MVDQNNASDDEPNPLEQMFFGGSAPVQEQSAFADCIVDPPVQKKPQQNRVNNDKPADNSSEEEYEDEYGAECDANGDVAICDACSKVLPLSKFEKHVSYFCKKQVAECPLCFEKFPSGILPYHMDGCKVAMRDPNMVTCKFCKMEMLREELKDHAIAHLVHQK